MKTNFTLLQTFISLITFCYLPFNNFSQVQTSDINLKNQPEVAIEVCPAPTNLDVQWSMDGGIITWDGNVTSYHVKVIASSFTSYETDYIVTENQYVFGPLDYDTQYTFEVSSICNDGQSSPTVTSFSTPKDPCYDLMLMEILTQVELTSAEINWKFYGDFNAVQFWYSLYEGSQFIENGNLDGPDLTLFDLSSNTEYTATLYYLCSDYIVSYPVSFTTNGDNDGDGVLNSDDICEGYDDNQDKDGDGIPDGCDNCQGDKLTICHIDRRGRRKSICVSEKQLERHLSHGDQIGLCSENAKVINEVQVNLSPNPAVNQITIELENASDEDGHVTIMNQYGERLDYRPINQRTTIPLGTNYGPGLYIAIIEVGNDRVQKVFVVHK